WKRRFLARRAVLSAVEESCPFLIWGDTVISWRKIKTGLAFSSFHGRNYRRHPAYGCMHECLHACASSFQRPASSPIASLILIRGSLEKYEISVNGVTAVFRQI